MKGWEINAFQYDNKKEKGVCPVCGSTDIKIDEFIRGHRKSISFLCRKCGSGDHFDGFTEELDKE